MPCGVLSPFFFSARIGASSSAGFFNLGVKKMIVLVGPESVCSSGVGSSCSGRAHDLQIGKSSGQRAVSRVRLRPYEAKRVRCLAGIGRWPENVWVRVSSRKLNGDLSSARQATQSRRAFRYVTLDLRSCKV